MSGHHFWKNAFSALVFAVGLSTLLLSLSSVEAQPTVTDGDHPPGYDGFQFDPPFNNNNPFDAGTLMMVDEGFDLFVNETFDGNGRKCGSCHIPEAQYNVLPGDIQKMTAEQRAEVLGGANTELENPELTEKFALFNITDEFSDESAGNMDEPVGPFRASMPLLSNGLGLTTINFHVCRGDNFTQCKATLPTTGLAPNPDFPGCTETAWDFISMCVATVPALNAKPLGILPNTNQAVHDGLRDVMLGWGGNGAIDEMFAYAPKEGSDDTDCQADIAEFANDHSALEAQLALFALTAVKTHFPITQDRTPGVDFRCPTVDELVKMAKHQKWLGRRYELDITELDFATSVGNEGRDLFLNRNAGCGGCHINAGSNDDQGRLKLGPFDVIPPLTNDQVALRSGEYECPEEVDCVTDPDCLSTGREDVVGYTCDTTEVPPRCEDGAGNPLLVDPLLDALDELMPRSGMGANKTSRSGVQFLEPSIDSQVAAVFPFDPGDGQLRGTAVNGHRQAGINVQPAFQAAIKTHFFHNNAVSGKLETAIAQVYFTSNFDASQGGNAIRGDFRCGKTGPQALAALGGPEAIDKIGYFLRSLFVVYALSDCERFMDEAMFRINEGLPVDLPLTHCQFELNDLQTALKGSNIKTKLNNTVLSTGNSISGELTKILAKMNNSTNGSGKKQDKMTSGMLAELEAIREDLVDMRHSIAETPEIED